MKINFNSPRKKFLPLNILVFNFCRLWPFRKKRIWIFGAWEGEKYDDNSKTLFEYINKNHSDKIKAIWLTNSPKVLDTVRGLGYEAYLNTSFRGRMSQLQAGVAFYTNGLIDYGIIPLVGGAQIVALWHGMSFKKIYNGNYQGISLLVKKILDHFFSWTYRTITPVTSDYARRWVEEMFTLNKKKIFITGQPRNDCFKNITKEAVLSKTSIDPRKRLILYMPTYRKPCLGGDAMEKIIVSLYNSEDLKLYLKNSNSVFVVKLHPLTPHINIENTANFVIFDNLEVKSNQELLGVADILVTDYSSCFVDYALLNRPIIFYVPDEVSFLSQSESMERDFFEIENLCKATVPKELIDFLKVSENKVSEITNSIFEDESIKGTCYSENVYNVICKEIGLE